MIQINFESGIVHSLGLWLRVYFISIALRLTLTHAWTMFCVVFFLVFSFTNWLCLFWNCLALHVPIPFIYLTHAETKTLMKFLDFASRPILVFFEFSHQNFVLNTVLSQALLGVFASFRSMTDEHNRNLVLFHRVFDVSEGRIASFCDSLFFCTFKSSSMLFKSRFWFAHEESINTLVEIFTSHVVIDYSNSFCKYGFMICIVNVVFNFG